MADLIDNLDSLDELETQKDHQPKTTSDSSNLDSLKSSSNSNRSKPSFKEGRAPMVKSKHQPKKVRAPLQRSGLKGRRRGSSGAETPADDRKRSKPVSGKANNRKNTKSQQEKLPVTFEGEELSGLKQLGSIELHRNIKVVQGDLKLSADTAKILFDKSTDEVKQVIVKGNVQMSALDPQTQEIIEATSEIAQFDAIMQKIDLIDDAKLKRGLDTIRGQIISYDLATGRLKANKVKGLVKPSQQLSN